MLLQDILKTKGSVVYSIGPDATVADAVRELVARHVGALVVCQTDPGGSERLLGIISERDLLYAHADQHGPAGSAKPPATCSSAAGCPWMAAKVADLMTSEVITVARATSSSRSWA